MQLTPNSSSEEVKNCMKYSEDSILLEKLKIELEDVCGLKRMLASKSASDFAWKDSSFFNALYI